MSGMDVTLAGLVMDGTPDADGVRWFVADLTGWDAPPVRLSESDITGRHGGYGTSPLWAARLMTLQGWAECPDQATAYGVRDRLPGLNAGELVVHEPTPKSIDVTQGGSPRSDWPLEGPTPIVQWQIPLIARDPFKRALTPTTVAMAAGATASHTSATVAPAEIEVTTTTAGTVVLSIAGLTLRTSSVPAGTVLTSGPGFSNPERSVRGPGGEDLFGATLSPMQWPAISPGDNDPHQAGTADLDIVYYPTYA